MDIWRYSDWDGYKQELRGSQRHIWRWRDWIVNSLNADKPYDQMIVEMLAADETAPINSDILAATGFLARNFHVSNRNIWLDATVEHTAKAFLGMTLNCARCHDHKYDPIPQQAYYEFRAIFEPHQIRTDRIPVNSISNWMVCQGHTMPIFQLRRFFSKTATKKNRSKILRSVRDHPHFLAAFSRFNPCRFRAIPHFRRCAVSSCRNNEAIGTTS